MAKLKIEGYIGYPEGMEILSDQPFFNLQKLDEWLEANKENDVTIEINSGGGSVREGWAMYDRLKASGRKITTEALGMVGSIATIFLLAAPKGNRKAHKNSKGFIHNPFWQPMSPDPMEADDAKMLEKDLRDEEERILNFYVQETGADKAKLQKYMKEKTELTADEMKNLGFVDEVIGSEVTAQRKFAVMAYYGKKTQSGLTDPDKSWIGKKIAGIEKIIKELTTSKIKSMMAKLKDGVEIFIQSEDDMWVGKKAFQADQATPLQAGNYTLEDGRVVIVDQTGTVTEVKQAGAPTTPPPAAPPVNAEIEKLKKELSAAKEALEKIKAEEKDEKISELTKELVEIKNHFNELSGNPPARGVQNFKGGQLPKSMIDQIKELREKRKAA